MPFMQTPTRCWICGKTVSFEVCKFDEDGMPVHEECYVLLTKWREEQAQQKAA